MTVAHEDIRQTCSVITGILRRLGGEFDDWAADMNADASKRLEAAHRGAKLHATANAIHAIVDGTSSMASRLVHAEATLAAIADIVTSRATIDVKELAADDFNVLVRYSALIDDLRKALN